MALPHPTTKPSVRLASSRASSGSSTSHTTRVSRIRRDPPPVVKAEVVVDQEEREQWAVIVGIVTFALAIVVIVVAFGSYSSWSPAQYTVRVNCGAEGSDC